MRQQKGEMTVRSLYAQFSEDQDTVIKPQMPFVKCQRNSWMIYEVSDIKILNISCSLGRNDRLSGVGV